MTSLLIALAASAIAHGATVIDGDTFILAGEHIRIANIDAPETHKAKCDAERRLGIVATRRLEALLREGTVAIHRGDPTDGREVDRYGRTLATVAINGRDVGETLVAESLARRWTGRRAPWCG